MWGEDGGLALTPQMMFRGLSFWGTTRRGRITAPSLSLAVTSLSQAHLSIAWGQASSLPRAGFEPSLMSQGQIRC